MKNTRPKLDTTYFSFSADQSIRSPRTPTYVPSSPSFTVSPFDPCKLYLSTFSPGPATPPPPPPVKPLPWLWQCHLCNARYPLGVTRRCLYDGHYYCSGAADQPNLKKRKKKGTRCSSEFDYVAWREMGQWKKTVAIRNRAQNLASLRPLPIGCERCDYPSECRHSSSGLVLDDTRSRRDSVLFPYQASTNTDLTTTTSKLATTSSSYSIAAAAAEELERLSRFYSIEDASINTILAPFATPLNPASQPTPKHMKSKTTAISDERSSKVDGDNLSTPPGLNKVHKSAQKNLGRTPVLSPIQEELLKNEVGSSSDAENSVTPVLDIYKSFRRGLGL